jgi:hypothetical protein
MKSVRPAAVLAGMDAGTHADGRGVGAARDGPRDEASSARRWSGSGLLLIGVLALVRAHLAARPPPDPWDLGEPIALEIEALQGADFRLLPGVGPALQERLEEARIAAGGQLHPADLHAVRGVGPSLRSRWESLRTR